MKLNNGNRIAKPFGSLLYLFAGLSFIMASPILYVDSAESAPITASTSMTVMNVTKWIARDPGDSPITNFPIKATMKSVSITKSKISWKIENGLYGLLWAFWTEDNGKTFTGHGWDYVTPSHSYKDLGAGYPGGWVGTAIATCQDCRGHEARSTILFVNSYR